MGWPPRGVERKHSERQIFRVANGPMETLGVENNPKRHSLPNIFHLHNVGNNIFFPRAIST
jgi:hypothetical protein